MDARRHPVTLWRDDLEPTAADLAAARQMHHADGRAIALSFALADVETVVECITADGVEPSDAVAPAVRRMRAALQVDREQQQVRSAALVVRLGEIAAQREAVPA